MICTALNDLYYVEWYVLRWMICIMLSDLYYVERLELRWMICAALNYLHIVELFVVQRWMICHTLNEFYVEWFVLRWMICITLYDFLLRCKICTTSNDLYSKGIYSVERLVLRWMIRCMMDDLYNVESFGLRLIIDYRLFNESQVCLFEKILKVILH